MLDEVLGQRDQAMSGFSQAQFEGSGQRFEFPRAVPAAALDKKEERERERHHQQEHDQVQYPSANGLHRYSPDTPVRWNHQRESGAES